jgi:hypothetical protein
MKFLLIKKNYLLSLISLIYIFLLSCKIPEDSFENPLDLEANADKGIFPPALVFSPDSVFINSGESISIDLYALAVDSLAGAQIEIDYFSSSLSLVSVEKGDFFQANTDPIFIIDDNNSKLIIYVTYLGSDKTNLSGTGTIATLTFNSKIPGITVLSVNKNSILLNENSSEITINGYGRSIINAK